MNIYLSKHFEEMIRRQIESGRYANASEVVREALRQYEINDMKLERLRAMIAEADVQFERGEYTTVTDVRAFIEEKFERAVERAKAKQQVNAHAVAET